MLPRIANQKSSLSWRSRLLLLLSAIAFVTLPTFYQPAHSQFGPGGLPGGKPNGQAEALAEAAKKRPSLPPMAPPSVEYFPEPAGMEKKFLAALEEPIEFNFIEESLGKALAFIAEKHGLQFIIDKAKLEEESVATDDSDISLKLSGISLRSGLKILLGQKNLAYIIEDEVIKITTKTEAIGFRPTRIYPVRDLVGNVDADYHMLAQTIQSSLGGPPDHPWLDADGEGGSVAILPAPGCLVIRQTPQIHDEVLSLLRSLRKANAEMQPK